MATKTLLLGVAIVSLAAPAGAMSLSIDGSNCLTCDGSDLFLEIIDTGGSFDVTLIINTDDYFGTKDGIVQAGFGGIQDWTSVVLTSEPAGSTLSWADAIGANVSSGGLCKNGGTTSKICTAGYVDITGGGDHTWTFTVTGGTLKMDTADWHIGGQYADFADLQSQSAPTGRSRNQRGPNLSASGGGANLIGPKGHLISESGGSPPIPEPSSALLFGIGALIASRGSRRNR